jgi:uncharacterized DUF497 family protein
MKFTWNEAKRQSNLKKHGYDFSSAEQVFLGATITFDDNRFYYGEQRFNTMGLIGTTVVMISHTETNDTIHIISMREAEQHESRTFFSYLA